MYENFHYIPNIINKVKLFEVFRFYSVNQRFTITYDVVSAALKTMPNWGHVGQTKVLKIFNI